jgi:hypothetical protein
LFFALLFTPPLHLETRFLLGVQAAELLHESRFSSQRRSKEEHGV